MTASSLPASGAERRRLRRSGTVLALAFATSCVAVAPAAHAARTTPAPAAKVTVAAPTVRGTTVTVKGTVTLPRGLQSTAKNRKRVRVALTLTDAAEKSESFSAKIDAKRRFTAKKATRLKGRLKLDVRVKLGGKASGKRVARTVTVATAPSGGGPTTGSTGPGTTNAPQAAPTVLNGLFRLDPGTQSRSTGKYSGTYFRMGFPGGWEINANSDASDKTYTLLSPGTDGGLRTDRYQEPPVPAFDGAPDVDDPTITRGNALANRIVLPQRFFGRNFSIVTAAIDPQNGLADPLPVILAQGTRLSGQLSAWNAQWNGASFNQGSPKPAGTPVPSAGPDTVTTAVTGTYNPADRHFVLEWTSLIIGGPFNGHSGVWHLEGTFEPAG